MGEWVGVDDGWVLCFGLVYCSQDFGIMKLNFMKHNFYLSLFSLKHCHRL